MLKATMSQFLVDECGAIISAELVLVLTISVLAVVVGLRTVSLAVNNELADVGSAFGAIQQTYAFPGMAVLGRRSGLGSGGAGLGFGGAKGFVVGSGFIDRADSCDCSEVVSIGYNSRKVDGVGGSAGLAIPSGSPARSTPTRTAPPVVRPPVLNNPCVEEPCIGTGIQTTPTPNAGPLPVIPQPHGSLPSYLAPPATSSDQSATAPPVLVVP